MPGAVKPEACAEGMRIRFRWSDAYSLTSRFGLPGSGRTPAGEAVKCRCSGDVPVP
jgi:hypothetical protein